MPLDERVRRANVIQRTRPRDVEETLLQLINDDDPVIAAAAIDVVRQQRLWTLAPDVEHVLAHRDVRDWYVFEEASWALAEQRMPPERRRELWLEPLPAAVLADRLRELALFRSVTVDELFRIASTARQVRHDPGATLMTEGTTADTVHLLLDGHVVASAGQSVPETIDAPAALGFGEALEGAPAARTGRTAGIAVTLALTTDELRTLLADNTELVRGLFAEIANRPDGPGCTAVETTAAGRDLERLAKAGIEPVEKVLALQRVPSFSALNAEEIRQLANISRAVTMTAGTPLFEAAARPATWLLLSGEVNLEQPDGTKLTARGGDVIGSFCALAGREIARSANITRDGYALRIAADDLFELLGERPDLLRQLFAGLARTTRASV
jgi:CRP-like cAMP-binding protein